MKNRDLTDGEAAATAPMDDFISEDDLLNFEKWLRCQGVDPATRTITPEELSRLRAMFDEATRLRETGPKVGLMKLQRVPGEQEYAVAIRDGFDLWLTIWVRVLAEGRDICHVPPR